MYTITELELIFFLLSNVHAEQWKRLKPPLMLQQENVYNSITAQSPLIVQFQANLDRFMS